jgi:hypothetical protein
VSENGCKKARSALLGRAMRMGTAAVLPVVTMIPAVPVAAAEPDHDLPIVFHYHGQPSVPFAQQCDKVNGVGGGAVHTPPLAGGSSPPTTPRSPEQRPATPGTRPRPAMSAAPIPTRMAACATWVPRPESSPSTAAEPAWRSSNSTGWSHRRTKTVCAPMKRVCASWKPRGRTECREPQVRERPGRSSIKTTAQTA